MQHNTYNADSDVLVFPEEQLIYAGFLERLAAVIIDGLILFIPNFIITYFLGDVGGLVSLVMYWLYHAILESGEQQATFGKKALGLKVVDLNGGRISFGQATGRYFGKFVSAIIILIGYLMVLWDDKRQALHDKMASTLVVKQ
jgi:uncharacterized RDD family membrane protein YckC